MSNDLVRTVVSGSIWMGSGLGSVESALHRLFNEANDEVLIIAFTVSNATELFFDHLRSMLQRHIRVRMVINRFEEQHPDAQRRLQQVKNDYPGLFHLLSFVPSNDQSDLHAKVVVVDRSKALVGSANLSLRGLQNNHELGVVISGEAVNDVAHAIDLIATSPYVHDVEQS